MGAFETDYPSEDEQGKYFRDIYPVSFNDPFQHSVSADIANHVVSLRIPRNGASINLNAFIGLRHLKELRLADRHLQGTLSLSTFPQSLVTLDIHGNELTRIELT